MPRTRTIGSGITARDVAEIESATDFRAIADRWNRRRAGTNDFEAVIADTEAWARAVLKRARRAPNGRERGTDDTPENYAQRFLVRIRFIRDFIERGDSAQAARFAVELGHQIGQAALKFEWEPAALKGKKFIDKPARGLGRLYREVEDVLARGDKRFSEKAVLNALEGRGVVEGWDERNVRWTDDQGRKKTTARKTFADRLSAIRTRLA